MCRGFIRNTLPCGIIRLQKFSIKSHFINWVLCADVMRFAQSLTLDTTHITQKNERTTVIQYNSNTHVELLELNHILYLYITKHIQCILPTQISNVLLTCISVQFLQINNVTHNSFFVYIYSNYLHVSSTPVLIISRMNYINLLKPIGYMMHQ